MTGKGSGIELVLLPAAVWLEAYDASTTYLERMVHKMRLVDFVRLIDNARFSQTEPYHKIEQDLRDAIDHVRWPPNGPDFAIYPESGKKRKEGNGVKPIKLGFQSLLSERGWRLERRYPAAKDESAVRPGAFDAWMELADAGFSPFVIEWETGNISSSHRALNKMATGLQEGILSGGILVLPTRHLYPYLTDRIGNFDELKPYFKFWSSMPVRGFLAVVSVEHDRESLEVPRIPKGTDGRAIG